MFLFGAAIREWVSLMATKSGKAWFKKMLAAKAAKKRKKSKPRGERRKKKPERKKNGEFRKG